jgi:site-specific recombinase XerC
VLRILSAFLIMVITVKLDLRKSGETENGFPLVVYCSQNYKKAQWRTGFYVKLEHWNDKLAQPTKKHPGYYVLLDHLSKLKKRISNVIRENGGRAHSLKEIKAMVFRKESSVFSESAFNSFPTDYKGTNWSAVVAFDKFAPGVYFTEINKELVYKFRDHLLKKGNLPGGVDSYIRSLRAVWNRLSGLDNPFSGIAVEIPNTAKKVATVQDIALLCSAQLAEHGDIGSPAHYRDYWLLMFYLGGIDPEVLAKLRYDKHVVNNRIIFNRNKGRSKALCSNTIPAQAWEILEKYQCRPYLVPIYKSTNYGTFSRNFARRFGKICIKLGVSVALKPKGARYTFIDRAQQLLVDERITAQIVGHKRRTVTSIYTNDFPQAVQDAAHLKIISI